MVTRDPDANSRRIVESTLIERGLSLAPPLAELGSTAVAKATAISECAPLLISSLAVSDRDGFVVRRAQGLRFDRRFALVFGSRESLPERARALADHLLQSRGRANGDVPASTNGAARS